MPVPKKRKRAGVELKEPSAKISQYRPVGGALAPSMPLQLLQTGRDYPYTSPASPIGTCCLLRYPTGRRKLLSLKDSPANPRL